MGPELAGIRVDTLLKRHLGLSGTVVRRIKWLSDGILVDGRRVNTRYAPRAGEVLSVCLSDPERRSGIVPAPGPTTIRSVIFFCIITLQGVRRAISTRSTVWTAGLPA